MSSTSYGSAELDLHQARGRIETLEAENAQMRKALKECDEYFDKRSDAEQDSGSGGWIGNEEMWLLGVIREAQARLWSR